MSGRVRPGTAALALAAAFLLRLGFGLAGDFWGEDPLQIFLIGLKSYTTGRWPYFGPDVVYTHTQIPGALQGLLISAPLYAIARPEAPYVLLNVLSFASLVLLAIYVRRRVPEVPAWFVWTWLMFCPWTLNYSTHIVNPSYVLCGAIVFFVSAFELLPSLSTGLLPPSLAFCSMGFAVAWVAQLHLSFPLLLPFLLLVLVVVAGRDRRLAVRGVILSVAGMLVAGSTLVPTLARFGISRSASATANVQVTTSNLLRAPDVLARFFSFASFELPRFIGNNTATRMHFLTSHPWVVPFAVFAGLVGLIQPIILLGCLFWPRTRDTLCPDWMTMKWLVVGTLALLLVSFAFSVKDPASHTFYFTFPIVMVYSFYCWRPFFGYRGGRAMAAALLACGSITHLAIAVDNFEHRSLYVNRPLVVRAIEQKDYRLIGERRPVLWAQEEP